MDFENYIYNKIISVFSAWKDKGIYAISFFVYSNGANEYNGIANISEFSIGYCTEEGCNHALQLSEERWNLICCRQGETDIIKADINDEGIRVLFDWYKKIGIESIGYEDDTNAYDENMNYIGKGPNGYYELLYAVSNVARKLQTEGTISTMFGNIPVIVHDMDLSWYVEEATENANPKGEADVFIKAFKLGFPEKNTM